jgi:D-arabinitol dehydrogenase (NADP+)
MKAVIFPEVKKIEVKDVEKPKIANNEVLVKNIYAGFCGTDIHIYDGDFISTYPLIPGHEFSGVIEETGSSVTSLKKGDRISVYCDLYCGKCYYCRKNQQNHCENLKGYGIDYGYGGGFAEYSKILESNAYKINDNISMKEAALVEPLACCIYGLNRLKVDYNDKAIIFGVGSIGLILLQLLRNSGVSHITMVTHNKEKIRIGKEFGADEVVLNDESLDDKLKSISKKGFDVLIEATGIPQICEQIFKYTNKLARVLLYGVSKKDSLIKISPYKIYEDDLAIFGAFALRNTFSEAIGLLENKKIELEKLISHEFKLKDFNQAFEVAKSGKAIKIAIDCSL